MFSYVPLSIEHLGNKSKNGSCDGDPIKWILHVFDECVYTTQEEIGFILGLISIGCWVCSSLPQLIENYRKKHVEEAISFVFLMFWLFGDSTNLIGCILTKQLPIQLYTAVYYVSMDIIMVLQYLYYYYIHKKATVSNNTQSDLGNIPNNNPQINAKHLAIAAICFMCFMPLPIMQNWGVLTVGKASSTNVNLVWKSRNILMVADKNLSGSPLLPDTPEEIIGYVIGCVSSVFYLGSRLPQIFKNFRRGQTEGVSIIMFLLAVLGNALYGSSILLQEPDAGRTQLQYIIAHLPWLIGSLGTMSLDFTILGQIIYYNHKPNCCNNDSSNTDDNEPLLV